MEIVTLKGCKIHYDPKNISKEAALEQASRRIAEVRETGGRLKSFTAFVSHRGEEWYDELRKFKARMKNARKVHS